MLTLIIFLTILPVLIQTSAVQPNWIPSNYFKAGPIIFTFSSSTNIQDSTLAYSSSITNPTLKVPTLAITDITYIINNGRLLLFVEVVKYTATSLTFRVTVNTSNYLTKLKLTYMAIDGSFTPPFSMNYFFPNLAKNGTNINVQYYVNFTASTGVTLNTNHENVLLPFMHYIDAVTYDTTLDIALDFRLINSSFYAFVISSTSHIYLNYVGFSRLIFDKTAIESMGNDYFNYGIIASFNNNASALSTVIPPNIIPQNLFYGMHSLNIQTGLSELNFTSNYVVGSGLIGFTSVGTYVYKQMKFSFMHHKSRKCPESNPYYNLTEMLCYDLCAVTWFGDTATMTCKRCFYTCYTCTSSTTCKTCNDTTDFRTLSGSQCIPLAGYYDTGSQNRIAQPCASLCATCSTSSTNCLSCVSGYYAFGGNCWLCSDAIPSCDLCTNSSFCTLCRGGGNGTTCTSCPSSYYLDPTTNSCAYCSSTVGNCYSCVVTNTTVNGTVNYSAICTFCKPTFTLINASCSCTNLQYLVSGQCRNCSVDIKYCATCVDANTCMSCLNNLVLYSATVCSCNYTTYLDSSLVLCRPCLSVFPYCQSCTSTVCQVCLPSFMLVSNRCICATGFYANSTNNDCESCSLMAYCSACSSSSICTACESGYVVSQGNCVLQTCFQSHCDICVTNSSSVCFSCLPGYSIGPFGTCLNFCGNKVIYSFSEQCDDGNNIGGDGCSPNCRVESNFTCSPQIVNSTSSYSWCYYTGGVSFHLVWIRKFQGNNSLKFEFQLDQQLNEWAVVNFTKILSIDTADPASNLSTGMGPSMILNYSAGYKVNNNRFWVVVNYVNFTMETVYLVFTLTPYANNAYPIFSPPYTAEMNPPFIGCYVTVLANNNQNSNVYSPTEYSLYSSSVTFSYVLIVFALFAVLVSLVFRAGKVIVFEMIAIMQLNYFALAFLDSMNPVFSGLLPLRYLAGILTFQDVEQYLQETTSPNSMKGVYMFQSFSQNFSFEALFLTCFIGTALLLKLILLIKKKFFCQSQIDQSQQNQSNKSGCFTKIINYLTGQLSLSLIFYCLPFYIMSLLFHCFFNIKKSQLWDYIWGLVVGLSIIIYFISMVIARSQYSISSSQNEEIPHTLNEANESIFGQYVNEFKCSGCLRVFKYFNLLIIEQIVMYGLIMLTLRNNSRDYSSMFVIVVAVVDMIYVVAVRPYRYAYISCYKGQGKALLERIDLQKPEPKQSSISILLSPPECTHKTQEQYSNNSQICRSGLQFNQKDHSGKSQYDHIHQTTESIPILFNNNTRRILNLTTIIITQLIFLCARKYHQTVNLTYPTITPQNFLAIGIHMTLILNIIYNYIMLALSIISGRKENDIKIMPTISGEIECGQQITKSNRTEETRIQTVKKTTSLNLEPNHAGQQVSKLKTTLDMKGNDNLHLKRPRIVKTGVKYLKGQKKVMINPVISRETP